MARNEQRQSEQGYELLTVQCRMARAALAWGVRDLAGAARLSVDTVARFERGKALCGLCIPSALDEEIQHLTLVVDRPPEPVFTAAD